MVSRESGSSGRKKQDDPQGLNGLFDGQDIMKRDLGGRKFKSREIMRIHSPMLVLHGALLLAWLKTRQWVEKREVRGRTGPKNGG